MKIALLSVVLASFVLAGCQTVIPVKQQFPEAPNELLQPCAELKKLPANNQKLSVLVESVVDNYSLYHECKIKHDNWIEWYRLQMRNSNG